MTEAREKHSLPPSWRRLAKQSKDKLVWITVIIAAIEIREANRPARMANQAAIKSVIDQFRAEWLSMTRGRKIPGIIWRGNFELDLVEQIEDNSHRACLLNDLGYTNSTLLPDERLVVAHVHLVADIGNNDIDVVRSTLKDHWPGRWRTQVKGLYAHQSVEEALSKVSSYSAKNLKAYSYGGLNDVTVKFYKPYGSMWSLYTDSLYVAFKRSFRSKG